MVEETQNTQTDIDWENRVLCSDGNCIGTLGPDGRCKECGLPYEGDLPAAMAESEAPGETAPPEPPRPLENGTETEDPEEESASASDADWENRRLCVDGNCIGVIGPDGHCKECGRPDAP
jgi:hypothetical protein